jgi:hypothetical protein
MPLPTSRRDLESFGYSKTNDSHCSGCGAEIEWWVTPRGKKMPFIVTTNLALSLEVLTPHFADCPKVKDFRRPK